MFLPALGAAIWCVLCLPVLCACVLAGRCEARAARIMAACSPVEAVERLAG